MDVVLALQLLAAVLAAWLILPSLLIALGISRVRGGLLSDERRMEEIAPPPELAEEIASIGARPLGLYWENAPLSPVFVEQFYTCPPAQGFVTAYRLGFDRSVSVALITGFESGSVAFTQNYEGGLTRIADGLIAGPPRTTAEAPTKEETKPAPRPAPWVLTAVTLTELASPLVAAGLVYCFLQHTYLVWVGPVASLILVSWIKGRLLPEVASANDAYAHEEDEEEEETAVQMGPKYGATLAEVLEEHQRRVEAFQLAGDRPIRHATHEDFLETQRIFNHHPAVVGSFRLASLETAWGLLTMLAMTGLGTTWLCGTVNHVGVWGTVCAAAGGLLCLLRRKTNRAEVALLRELKASGGGRAV